MENGNSRILFVIDLIIMFICFLSVFHHYQGGTTVPLKGAVLMGLIIIIWFLISINIDILRINRLSNTIKVLKDILIAYSVLSAIMIAAVAIFGEFNPNDKLILYPLLFGFILSSLMRLIYSIGIKHFLRCGYLQKSVLIIGSGHTTDQVTAKILDTPEMGLRIKGIMGEGPVNPAFKRFFIGGLDQFPEALRRHSIDQVIIAKPLGEKPALGRIISLCDEMGVRFCIVPDFYNLIPKWTICNSLGDIPVIAVRNDPLNIFSNRVIKRTFDIIVSSLVLMLLAPLFLVIGIGVKISSSGPIFFRQKRIGNNNAEFTLYKFRSMIVQPPQSSDTLWTLPDDKRVTPFGKILRKTNLDELPQLWNVLVGDMSIVGPRPEREHFVEKFSQEIPNYRIRHLVKSGITGLAQANGWRGDTSIEKRVENDLYYLENWSFWLDLKIIFLTFFNRAAWKNAI